MVTRTSRRPLDAVRSGTWPHATLASDAPASAVAAQRLAAALADAMDSQGVTQRAVAAKSGVAHTTIGRILAGHVVCDVGTLAALEGALDAALWSSPDTRRV